MENVEDEEGFTEDGGKKHLCTTCGKRFNRPSSLRIHGNTHTGATPFRCPHAGCGRAFNVQSNMRRHYRNHAINQTSSAESVSRSPVLPVSTPTPSPTSPFSYSRHVFSPPAPLIAHSPKSNAQQGWPWIPHGVKGYSHSDVPSAERR
ncbi:hypothetical protein FB45DRAFT_756095 [Roridomyces roridus]|uniref:C2H2-type domain-containing protein n=1 Tax=Roridomyces roridus TaxID=1738132 RepID=A0AAD7BCZ9_9AGAR|nr:hypothetical protein FB45DRAFT_756095 [Roridomyces roridus]